MDPSQAPSNGISFLCANVSNESVFVTGSCNVCDVGGVTNVTESELLKRRKDVCSGCRNVRNAMFTVKDDQILKGGNIDSPF